MSRSLYDDGIFCKTSSGSELVPELIDDENLFLNRLTIIYGETGTGKTTVITHILNTLKQQIPVAVVANPTNRLNKNYNKYFPDQSIHDELSKTLLKNLLNRQKKSIGLYNLINDITALDPIFSKCSTRKDKDKIGQLLQKFNEHKKKIKQEYDEINADKHINMIQEMNDNKIISIMQNVINENSVQLLSEMSPDGTNYGFSDKQLMIIKNILFNPNLLLLLDDCASTVKDWKDLTEIKQLFFEGRHYHTTVIISMHNVVLIPPPLRNNAHINIYTTEASVNTYLRKDSSGISKDFKKKMEHIAQMVFKDSGDKRKPNYKKLCYFGPVINIDDRIQYLIAKPSKFRFGSVPFWTLCSNMKKSDQTDAAALVNYFS